MRTLDSQDTKVCGKNKHIMRKQDEKFMLLALLEAEKAAELSEVPVGAVLVSQDGTILGKGHNQTISTCDPTAHAEIVSLREAGQKLRNYRLISATLYVTVEPCPMCMGALIHARVPRLVYGTKAPKWGAAGTLYDLASDSRLNHTIEVTGGVLEERCREIMQSFFKTQRGNLTSSNHH
jgi:tRNA(adenine34) deaminase